MEITPYNEGQRDRARGKRRNDNPHHMAASAHESWDDGWVDKDAELLEADCAAQVK